MTRWMIWHAMVHKMSGYVPDPSKWIHDYTPQGRYAESLFRFVNSERATRC